MFQHEHSFHTIILTTAISHTIDPERSALYNLLDSFSSLSAHLAMQIPRNVGEYVLRTGKLVISIGILWSSFFTSSDGMSVSLSRKESPSLLVFVKRRCGCLIVERHSSMLLLFVGSRALRNGSMSFARWREVTRADDSAGAAHGS